MNFLVKKIMEVSSKQGPLSRSPSTTEFEDIDGQIIDLDKEKPNGHGPPPKPVKNNDNCCV